MFSSFYGFSLILVSDGWHLCFNNYIWIDIMQLCSYEGKVEKIESHYLCCNSIKWEDIKLPVSKHL